MTAGGNNKDLKELRAIMKQLTASVTFQAETLAALSIKTHSGGGSGGKNTETKKTRPCLHVWAHCKRGFYLKDGNFLELAASKAKCYKGWTSILQLDELVCNGSKVALHYGITSKLKLETKPLDQIHYHTPLTSQVESIELTEKK